MLYALKIRMIENGRTCSQIQTLIIVEKCNMQGRRKQIEIGSARLIKNHDKQKTKEDFGYDYV